MPQRLCWRRMNYEETYRRIVEDSRYQENLDWGQPRKGHPEGSIRAHIEDLERNLAAMRSGLTNEEYWKLKILIHVHDTFKPEARDGVPICDPRSHASLARAFLAEFCDDADLLTMVQLHDEPYALWRAYEHRGDLNEKRLQKLIDAIEDWDLFLAFQEVDGNTAGKSPAPREWFRELVRDRVPTRTRGVENLLAVDGRPAGRVRQPRAAKPKTSGGSSEPARRFSTPLV